MIPPSDCVVDASVALKWVLDETDSALAVRLLDGRLLYAPALIDAESANALWAVSRRGTLTAEKASVALAALLAAPVTRFDLTPDLVAGAFRFATDLRHPVYDCLYLATALALGIPVMTADRRFRAAAAQSQATAQSVFLLGEEG